MTNSLIKVKMVELIYHRLNKSLKRDQISDALKIICDYLIESTILNSSVSIENFGTFSPVVFPPHKGYNVELKEMQNVPPFKRVKFRPHITVVKMLKQTKEAVKK